MLSSVKYFKDQNYEQLKSKHSKDNLFEDPHFPSNDSSLFTRTIVPNGICWMRADEANSNPQFVVDGFGRCDLDQGFLGNWFASSPSADVFGLVSVPVPRRSRSTII